MFEYAPRNKFGLIEIYDHEPVDHTRRNLYNHHVEIKGFPYLNLADVKRIYEVLKGSIEGVDKFAKEAKLIAAPRISGSFVEEYQFNDEEALFNLLKKHFAERLKLLKITTWNELMQYIA